MAVRIDSEASCRAAYIDYYTNKDTKVTKEEMARIVQRYNESTRKSWQEAYTRSSNDVNRYEFDDEQFEDIRLENYDETKETYGEDTNINAEKARNVGDGIAVGVSGAAGIASNAISSGTGLLNKLFNGSMFKGGKGGLVGFILGAVSCTLSFAVALHARLNKANEEEIKAVNELSGEMETQQNIVNEQQNKLKDIEKNIQDASDNATKENEEANQDIQKRTNEHLGYSNTYNVLQAKINSGKELSQSEIQLYNSTFKLLNTTSADIKTRTAAADETLTENYASIQEYGSEFDIVATEIASVQGVTDYAADLDEATKKSCETQSKIQKWNTTNACLAATGMVIATATFAPQAAIAAWVIVAIGAVFTGLAVAAAIMGKKSTQEQTDFAAQADAEIALRQNTEAANTSAKQYFDSNVDQYNTSEAVIKELTVEEPNNLQQPTNTTIRSNPNLNLTNNNNEEKNGKPKFLT